MTVQAWQINRATVATAPASLPISLSELKDHLRITTSAEDTYLTRCLSMGVARAEAYLGAAMVNRTLDLTLDQVRPKQTGLTWETDQIRTIALPQSPLSSVTGVYTTNEAGAESTVSSSEYTVSGVGDPMARGAVTMMPTYVWPTDLRNVKCLRVRYVAGFGASAASVPEDYKQAALTMAAAFYGHRGDCSVNAQPTVEATLAAFDHLRAWWL